MVVYIQNVPRSMDPYTLKLLAQQFGEVSCMPFVKRAADIPKELRHPSGRVYAFVNMICQYAAAEFCKFVNEAYKLDDGSCLEANIDESKSTIIF